MVGPARAFGMEVIAWSQNLTDERAQEAGVRRVEPAELLAAADFLSIHLVLERSHPGSVRRRRAARDEADCRAHQHLAGSDRRRARAGGGPARRDDRRPPGSTSTTTEPLPPGHELTTLDNVVLLPHLGYVSEPGSCATCTGRWWRTSPRSWRARRSARWRERNLRRVLTRDASIVDLFLELVAVPSPSGRERALGEQIRDWLADAGVAAGVRRRRRRQRLRRRQPDRHHAGTRGRARLPVRRPHGHRRERHAAGQAPTRRRRRDPLRRRHDPRRRQQVRGRRGHAAVRRRRRPPRHRPADGDGGLHLPRGERADGRQPPRPSRPVDCAFCVDGSKPIGTVITRALGQTVVHLRRPRPHRPCRRQSGGRDQRDPGRRRDRRRAAAGAAARRRAARASPRSSAVRSSTGSARRGCATRARRRR